MAEDMRFLPRQQVLTLEEIERVARLFVAGGVRKLRLTVEGRLLLCLGHEHSLDLRALLRRHPLHDGPLLEAIGEALQRKPARHEFSAAGEVQVLRFMNMSGG